MFNIMCVTNRKLCEGDFLSRIEKIASHSPSGIILREKDLSPNEYETLALSVMKICDTYNVPCILHSFVDVAVKLNATGIHLPMPKLREMCNSSQASNHRTDLNSFKMLGASCHSVDEALEAERLGCTYITVGHIFSTECKKGLKPRGLDFLTCVCDAVNIPVYAIGGINENNIADVESTGAAGACIMSGLMNGSFRLF